MDKSNKKTLESPKYQILIARYKEKIDYLNYLPKRENRNYEVIVSNSGDPEDQFSCDRTIVRENVGREAGHYLNFMASEYENMAPTVVFVQAGCFAHLNTIEPMLELFYGSPEFPFPMSFFGTNNNVCIPKVPRWSEAEHIIKSAWQEDKHTTEIFGKNGSVPWVIGGGAQFYIKKEIVLKKSPEHYLRAIECARDPESKLAHVLEFHWPNMFDLSCLHQETTTA
jgi:hypothetical protein